MGDGHKNVLQKFDLKLETDSRTVTDDNQTTATEDDSIYRVHLDNSTIVASSSATYNATTDKTTFTIPTGFNNSSGQLAVYVIPSGNDDTFIGMTDDANLNSTTVELDGNWKTYVDTSGNTQTPANDFILGYHFTMEVEFPTVYIQSAGEGKVKSETRGSLIVHRVNFSFGEVGLIETTLKRRGRNDYSTTYESLEWDSYLLGTPGITKDYIHTIPIYDRNTNVSLHLKSTHPSPATLHSLTWEGDFSHKLYQRV